MVDGIRTARQGATDPHNPFRRIENQMSDQLETLQAIDHKSEQLAHALAEADHLLRLTQDSLGVSVTGVAASHPPPVTMSAP